MIRFNCLFVLAGVFQVITSQGPPGFPPGGPPGGPPRGPPGFENIPEKCRGPPQGVENPEQCCQIDPLYTKEDLDSCGFKQIGGEDDQERRGPPDCSKYICMLKLNDLVDENNEMKWANVEAYIDERVRDSSSESAAQIAKAVCINGGDVPGPSHICVHARLIHCVGAVMFGNCPDEKWMQTNNCKALKDHIEMCKAPFQ